MRIRGPLELTDGLGTDPAIQFASDSNTGIWRPGEDEIAFGGGGVRALVVSPTRVEVEVPLDVTGATDLTGELTVTGGATLTGTVDAEAFGNKDTGVTRVAFPEGGAYEGNTASVSGAIYITLPQFRTNTMVRFRVSVFEYLENKSFDLMVAGYIYSGGGGYWVNKTATLLGAATVPIKIRFIDDGTSNILAIGELTDTWSYPKVAVTEVVASHLGDTVAEWSSGWDITMRTAAWPAGSVIWKDAAIVWTSINDGAGSLLNADKVDGYEATNLARLAEAATVSGLWNYTTAPTIQDNTVWHDGNTALRVVNADIAVGTITEDRLAFTLATQTELDAHTEAVNPHAITPALIGAAVSDSHGHVITADGWYTIAAQADARGTARFVVDWTEGGNHGNATLIADHIYGLGNSITVLGHTAYSTTRGVLGFRIVEAGTYDGALLQVNANVNASGAFTVRVYENHANTWVLKDWIADGTDPGTVTNHTLLTNVAAEVDLWQGGTSSRGGMALNGPIFAGGATTQYEVWHGGNDGAGSGLDADQLDGYEAADFGALAEAETVTGNWDFTGTSTHLPGHYFHNLYASGDVCYIHGYPAGHAGEATQIQWRSYDGVSGYKTLTWDGGADPTGRLEVGGSTVWHAGNTDGAVTEAKLATDSVSSAKLKSNSVTTAKILDGNVTAAKIADGAITAAKVAADVATQAELDAHDHDGDYISAETNGTVATANIADGAVTTIKIAAGAITAAKVAADVATQTELDAHIESANPHAVTAAQIGAAAILSELITEDGTGSGLDADQLDGYEAAEFGALAEAETVTGNWHLTATATHLPSHYYHALYGGGDVCYIHGYPSGHSENATQFQWRSYDGVSGYETLTWDGAGGGLLRVSGSTVWHGGNTDGAVTEAKLATDAVSAVKLKANAVTTAKILDGNVTAAKIADGAITAAKVSADVATQAELDAHDHDAVYSAVGHNHDGTYAIAAHNHDAAYIPVTGGAVLTANLADGAVTASKVAADVATQAELDAHDHDGEYLSSETAGAVGTTHLADDAVTAAKIADDAVTSDAILNGAVTAAKLAGGVAGVSSIQRVPLDVTGLEVSLGVSAGGSTTNTGTLDNLEVFPFQASEEVTVSALKVEVTTGKTSDIRIVIYNAGSGGVPDTLLAESGNLSAASTGDLTWTTSQTLLRGRLYWIGVHWGGTPSLRAIDASDLYPLTFESGSEPPSTGYRRTGVTFGSASPSPFGSGSLSPIDAPAVRLVFA